MKDILKTIVNERLNDAQEARKKIPIEILKQHEKSITMRRSLIDRLAVYSGTDCQDYQHGTAHGFRQACVIAEVKKASPSAGLLCKDYNPADIAMEYERSGAVGISVLTEPRHFLGSDNDLCQVCKAVSLPVLRKDFISDQYQVYESAVLGADVILLIAAALDSYLLEELYTVALSIGLETIIEVHTLEELDAVLPLERGIVGVNSRNLRTLKTDLSVAKELAVSIPSDRVAIAESGIRSRSDIEELQALGYKGFLVGESLMKSADFGAHLKSLIG